MAARSARAWLRSGETRCVHYNSVGVHGVTDTSAQQRIIDKLAEYCRRTPTHAVQVMFYEEEHWTVRQEKNGATFCSGTPSKLVRVVNIV